MIPGKRVSLPKELSYIDRSAPMTNFYFKLRIVAEFTGRAKSTGDGEIIRFAELFYITGKKMHAFKLRSNETTSGFYTGPSPMVFYKANGRDSAGNAKFTEACSCTVSPGWKHVMIMMRSNKTGSSMSAMAIDASMSKLPKGTVAIVNYSPKLMKFKFGGEKDDPVYDIPPYGDIKLSLSKVPDNNLMKVMAVMKIGNEWKLIYKYTWGLPKNAREIYLMRPKPGSNPPKFMKERIRLAGFAESPNPRRPKMDDDDDDDR